MYVVLLQRPDGRIGFYVGQTALTPEERFAQHQAGIKASRHVRKCGVHLMPELYARFNPMTREEAAAREAEIADRFRRQGCWVEGGH